MFAVGSFAAPSIEQPVSACSCMPASKLKHHSTCSCLHAHTHTPLTLKLTQKHTCAHANTHTGMHEHMHTCRAHAERSAMESEALHVQHAAALEALQARTTVLEGRVRYLECELQVSWWVDGQAGRHVSTRACKGSNTAKEMPMQSV
eukprot:921339-Pelagomonas_calceolata.AAC.4